MDSVTKAYLDGLAGDMRKATSYPTYEERIACRNGWMQRQKDARCEFCGHRYDKETLGRYGCPNCEGEGECTTDSN